MAEQTAEQVKNTKWANWLLEELVRRTGRRDVEVRVTSQSRHDSLIWVGAAKQPVVSFYMGIRDDPSRLGPVLDNVSEMVKDWDVTLVVYEKAKRDCLPIHERVKAAFPHLGHDYGVVDGGKHSVSITRKGDSMKVYYDLWPQMIEEDIERLITHIKDLEDILNHKESTYAEVSYWWN